MRNPFTGFGYYWITGALFAGAISLQWITHSGTTGEFVNAVMENWQSEFLQLLWQVGGLALFFAVGSAQSKHESERLEAKVNHLIVEIHGLRDELSEGRRFVREIDNDYDPRKEQEPCEINF